MVQSRKAAGEWVVGNASSRWTGLSKEVEGEGVCPTPLELIIEYDASEQITLGKTAQVQPSCTTADHFHSPPFAPTGSGRWAKVSL